MIEREESISKLDEIHLINEIKNLKSVLWINPNRKPIPNQEQFSFQQMHEANERLNRLSSYIKVAFPETEKLKGIIESPLKEIPQMKKLIEGRRGFKIPGRLILKCDHSLPISGSIKARGGIYEVLKFAETIAMEHGLLTIEDNYAKLADESCKKLFSEYQIAVGSTGNLGLSIGIISAKLGFQVTVHMSHDAKAWKKQLLRDKGVTVIEYESDYSKAVEQGRKQAQQNPKCHFVDDENSVDLFAGYSVATLRLEKQLQDQDILVDANHPLFVYIPCGVGGAPGGIAFGLKMIFGENVHIFFGEPLQSPCMLLGLMTGLHDGISVNDIGLNNKTEADGLAVGRASKFVGKIMEPVLSGCYTVDDSFLFRSLKGMYEQENIFMEPSAHAGVFGPIQLISEGKQYLEENGLTSKMENATHLIWSTGGDMVPFEERKIYLEKNV